MIFQETYRFPTLSSVVESGIGIVRLRGILHTKFCVLRDSKSYLHHSSTTRSVTCNVMTTDWLLTTATKKTTYCLF